MTEPLRLEYRTPDELADNPANWRRHPDAQRLGLEGAMAELAALDDGDSSGPWAGAALYNERTRRLIDGHLRKGLDGALLIDGRLPVIVGRWSEEQERLILATLDPLAAMAEADQVALAELLESIAAEDKRAGELLKRIGEDTGADLGEAEPPDDFPDVDESLSTEHECPRCGYRWSGKSEAAG